MTQKKEKRDYRQEITYEIIRLIEAGTAPWQRPWDSSQAARLTERPYNAVTKRVYSGCNVLLLMLKSKAFTDAATDPRWCTFLQAKEQGWKIKKGSKGTIVEVWKPFAAKAKNEETCEDETVSVKPKLAVFYHTVFHAAQIEGIPAYVPPEKGREWDPLEAAETILKNSGAVIKHDETRAFYRPSSDEIHLPPKNAFPAPERYYQTAIHELSHWAGHPSRLNRDMQPFFGTPSDHPRIRGEVSSKGFSGSRIKGSPPHTRGSFNIGMLISPLS